MSEKLTVITSEKNEEAGGYRTLLSNGVEVHTTGAYPAGVEYVEEDAAKLARACADNATLQRGLDEANATIATLSAQNGSLTDEIVRLKAQLRNNVAPVPPGLIGVTTANVENLPTIDQLPQHEPMAEPAGALSPSDQRDVEEHLARKRAVTTAVIDGVEGTKA